MMGDYQIFTDATADLTPELMRGLPSVEINSHAVEIGGARVYATEHLAVLLPRSFINCKKQVILLQLRKSIRRFISRVLNHGCDRGLMLYTFAFLRVCLGHISLQYWLQKNCKLNISEENYMY